MCLDDILKEYCKCKKPFYKNPIKVIDGDTEKIQYLSVSGEKAYARLIAMLYDIGELTEVDVSEIVERLDDIADSEIH